MLEIPSLMLPLNYLGPWAVLINAILKNPIKNLVVLNWAVEYITTATLVSVNDKNQKTGFFLLTYSCVSAVGASPN